MSKSEPADAQPDQPGNLHGEHQALPRATAGGLCYRCVCGTDISLNKHAGEHTSDSVGRCPNCNLAIPPGVIQDPTVTITLPSLKADSTDDITIDTAQYQKELKWAANNLLPSSLSTRDSSSRISAASSQGLTDNNQQLTDNEQNLTANEQGLTNNSHDSADLVSAGGARSRPGRRLGHFVLQEALGNGGMGTVYRALDTSLERYVAVKVLRQSNSSGSSVSGGPGYNDRLRREAVSQARLNHPNVVTIYYVGREGEEPFLAMELLPGPTLQERLADGPLPYDELILYANQVVKALAAADLSGLVHGDIKPSNLLMAGPGHVKLSDFGLSRRSGSARSDGSISGTPNYIAPELIDGQPPDRRADMYALGVTLFELAFARRPFALKGSSLHERLLSHQTATIEFPEKWPAELPESFRDVLARLLAKHPDDRYQDYGQLREALQSVAPIGSTLAGRPARFIAWAIDMSCLFLLQAPFILPNLAMTLVAMDSYNEFELPVSYGWVRFLLGCLALVGWIGVPSLALWWDLKRWRTPGRYLMQLRVVDVHGLPPPTRVLIARSILRYLEFWIGAVFSLPLVLSFPIATAVAKIFARLWIVVDGVFVFGPTRRPLHDRICRTHVVLDERSSRKFQFNKPVAKQSKPAANQATTNKATTNKATAENLR